jgi:hypothetical protein
MRSADSQSQSANYEARSDFSPVPNASQLLQTNDYFDSAQQARKPSTSHQGSGKNSFIIHRCEMLIEKLLLFFASSEGIAS